MLSTLRRGVHAARSLRLPARGPLQAVRSRAFLNVARQSFVELQAAWDRADWATLAKLATGPLLDDLREQHALRGPGPHHTEVLELHAELRTLEELREAFVASVEFHGLIREQADGRAEPFRELWLLAKVKAEPGGWRLARVQALA